MAGVFDGYLPAPTFANLETTRYCNLQCSMCIQYQDGTTTKGPHMQLQLFELISDALFPHLMMCQPSVSGEPLMWKHFDAMIEKARRFGVKLNLVTNATLLSDARIAKLAPVSGVVMFSVDGPDAETFEGIRTGARFSRVMRNIKRFSSAVAELPVDQRPETGINCTIMRRNIEALPDLVRLAARELHCDFVQATHVFPVTEETKAQSLIHYRDLAMASIEKAVEAADQYGIALVVQPLDQITATSARSEVLDRELSASDGHVEGLGYRTVNQDTRRPAPVFSADSPDHERILEFRRRAVGTAIFPPRYSANAEAPHRESIQVCDFLWNKTYVHLDGDVRPCCVFGTPIVGNLIDDPLESVWNGAPYRAMRQRLVRKDPVASCRGCMHIRTVTDPTEIDQWLQGREIPEPWELEPLPEELAPNPTGWNSGTGRSPEHSGPPILHWTPRHTADGYEVEFSLNGGGSAVHSTLCNGGALLRFNRFRLPRRLWARAPLDTEVTWQAFAHNGGPREFLGGGTLLRRSREVLSAGEKSWLESDNRERLLEDLKTRRLTFKSQPQAAYVQLSDYCNMSCIMCRVGTTPPPTRMREDLIDKVGDQVLRNASILAPFGGSEPLVYTWKEARELARRFRLELELVTNLQFLDEKKFRELEPYVNLIRFSIDSHIPEIYEHIRRNARTEQVFRNLRTATRLCNEAGIEVAANIVLMTENAAWLPETIDFLAEVGIPIVHVLEYIPLPNRWFSDPSRCYTKEYIAHVRSRSLQVAKEKSIRLVWEPGGAEVHDFRIGGGPRYRYSKTYDPLYGFAQRTHPGFCFQALRRVQIGATGHVWPCCRTQGGDLLLGDLQHEDFEDIWNGPTSRDLRRGMMTWDVPSPCRSCSFFTDRVPPESWLSFLDPIDRLLPEPVHRDRSLRILAPDHMTRHRESPVFRWAAPDHRIDRFGLVIGITGTLEPVAVIEIPGHVTEVRLDDSTFGRLAANTGHWWTLYGHVESNPEHGVRGHELRCLIRHHEIPRIAGSTLKY